jgi:hypothetical protein
MKWTGSPDPVSITSELSGVYSVIVPVLSIEVALVPAVGGTLLVLEFCPFTPPIRNAAKNMIVMINLIIVIPYFERLIPRRGEARSVFRCYCVYK